MLEVKNLEIEIDNKVMINKLSFVLNSNDKMAIIGEEGNGKSTLLKSIVNEELVQYAKISGDINLKGNSIGYLEQTLNPKWFNKPVNDYLFENEEDYINKINDLYKLIRNLNVSETVLKNRNMKTLSGGEKVKLGLIRLLLNKPDILLLDEPTNDLDIETLEWLEQFIIEYPNPIIFISHDETLLSKTANMILHLELIKGKTEPKHTVVRNNYDDYIEHRIININKQTKVAVKERINYGKQKEKLLKVMQKVEYQQDNISRSDPHGGKLLKKKMKNVKSQEKKLNEKELVEIPNVEESINFFFEPVFIPEQKEILRLKLDEMKINDIVLVKNIVIDFRGPRHIVIIGKNGVGKTTLFKIIYNNMIDRKDIILGYMPQDYDEILSSYATPIDFLCNTGEKDEIAMVRSYMGNMNFTRTEMTQGIDELSGGSKTKLILLKLILNKCNVLLLDEPTRNVSPLSNPVIRKVLRDFTGTIISISHDRKYIDEVCDTIFELTKNGLIYINK